MIARLLEDRWDKWGCVFVISEKAGGRIIAYSRQSLAQMEAAIALRRARPGDRFLAALGREHAAWRRANRAKLAEERGAA